MTVKTRVGIVYGGKSGEHAVSLQTALAVIGAFDFDKYEITPFFIDRQGNWKQGQALAGPVASVEALQLADVQGSTSDALQSLFAIDRKIDVIFPLLHGTNGEDGTIQGLFEMANIPYVGCGVLASSAGMDKVIMKRLFEEAGLPQCAYRHFTRKQWKNEQQEQIARMESELGYPAFVKPANLGSSVGISKAKDREQLVAAVEEALRFDNKVIVEEFVDGREIEVAVLGNDFPEASVPGEVIASNEFYDYKAKYIDGKSRMQIPAEVSAEQQAEIRALAVKAFMAVDGSGLSRVDFFLRRSDGAWLLNEINTLPGFTPFSMYPLMWKETGKPYRELLDDLIGFAFERYNEKQSNLFDFNV
jgi:D-alanine-D-alanine ligase